MGGGRLDIEGEGELVSNAVKCTTLLMMAKVKTDTYA